MIGRVAIDLLSDPEPLLKGDTCTAHAAVSPNGHWIAYRSRSGRDEIYVERYPQLGGKERISTSGGTVPRWSSDGKELYFISLDGRQTFSVTVQSGETLGAGRPQQLFEFVMPVPVSGARPYDVLPDGRFVMIRNSEVEAGGPSSNLIVVQNWFEELKRLVPIN